MSLLTIQYEPILDFLGDSGINPIVTPDWIGYDARDLRTHPDSRSVGSNSAGDFPGPRFTLVKVVRVSIALERTSQEPPKSKRRES
jgi:hypothetical protein